ncbi:CsbD family protein [Corynebacterium glucuronolyticum]|uniref:CsbD family protein n=1 Tax=Corynebacterium glucuronolyticum TaxID=39791 RepID=UPI00223BA48A|nr:CsbD family protein [Corynebacterium glucuronolyticum]MCT1564510.1 CsbD family protein [Corynebacterium glucuronolyticum]
MGDIQDDIKNKAEEFGGKAKEGLGNVTDNEKLEAEGKADQTKSDIKQGIEELGDKVKEAGDKILGAFQDEKK